VSDPARWEVVPEQIRDSGDRFIPGWGLSIYARVHYLRGLENAWTDIYLEPERLGRLIDLLTELNLEAIRRYAEAGAHAIFTADDWGWQDRLMIDPEKWREIWKPRYARMYAAAHEAGLFTMLHSCGYIVDILDDLIEAGLDVIQMDQQRNMGLEVLGERFGGRITFYCPPDIQTAMQWPLPELRAYCRQMVECLGREEGGFIAGLYPSPESVGHTPAATEAACEEFLKISEERYGRSGP
jgi:uroporphyrinogen-III decarboxylase